MRNIVFFGALAVAGVSAGPDQSCYAHISVSFISLYYFLYIFYDNFPRVYSHNPQEKCEEPGGNDWTTGSCSSVHGGFKGNSDNLHRIIVDDFTDSMNYLLMVTFLLIYCAK